MSTVPTIDPDSGKRINSRDSLVAIVHWMGSYEGMSGNTLHTLLEQGTPDGVILGEEEIPADMLAGYRYAAGMLAQVEGSFSSRAAAAAARPAKAPKAPKTAARGVVLSEPAPKARKATTAKAPAKPRTPRKPKVAAAPAAAQAEHEAQMANAAAIRAQRVRRTAARA